MNVLSVLECYCSGWIKNVWIGHDGGVDDNGPISDRDENPGLLLRLE